VASRLIVAKTCATGYRTVAEGEAQLGREERGRDTEWDDFIRPGVHTQIKARFLELAE